MPPRGRKRKSDQSTASDDATTAAPAGQQIATKTGSPMASPRKRQWTGITAAQKRALIDNLQLEVTERARRLRAQYRLQSQGLRTRIELRVNRIPTALRKRKMGDLLLQHAAGPHKPAAPKPAETYSFMTRSVVPSLPEKDYARPVVSRGSPQRPILPSELAGGDKENQNHLSPKKRPRTGGAAAPHPAQPGQVLSPATSNSRVNPRDRGAPTPGPASPTKSLIARPMSPAKQPTSLLSTMVEKARATRAAATRKATTSSMASSAAGGGGSTARSRAKAAAASTASTASTAAAAAPAASRSAAAAVARAARRVSGTSESSEGSTSTVVRKVGRPATASSTGARKTAAAATAASTRKTTVGTTKKRVTSATSKKAAAAATAPATTAPATTRSGRILRKRE